MIFKIKQNYLISYSYSIIAKNLKFQVINHLIFLSDLIIFRNHFYLENVISRISMNYVNSIFSSDKLKFRFVELLATSASKNDLIGRPEDVDESYLCGCPGKIIDAELLHEILKNPVDEHVFFGTGEFTYEYYDRIKV